MATPKKYPPYRPIRPSQVVAEAIVLWFRSLPQLLLVTALVHAPLIALKWWLRDAGTAGDWRGALARGLPVVEFDVVAAIVAAFAVRMVFQRLRGQTIALRRSIAVGLRRIATVLGIAAILATPRAAQIALDPMLSGLGSFFLYLPLVFVIVAMALAFCVATPVAVVEQRGVVAALRRSRDLSHGHRLEIFGMYLLLAIAIAIAGLPLKFLDLPPTAPTGFLIAAAANVGAASLVATLSIVLYHELRETKEGIGLEELAAVFE